MRTTFSLIALTGALFVSSTTDAADISDTNAATTFPATQPALRQQMLQLQTRVSNLENQKKKEGVHTQFSDRVSLSGGINVQAAFSRKSSPSSFTGPGNQTANLNTAYLNFNAILMPWIKSFFSLTYEPSGVTTTTGGAFTAPEVEQAYLQFWGEKNSHFHLDVGKQYVPFGVYNRYPVTDSLTQSLSEVNKVAAVAGAHYSPFFASLYAFNAQGSLNGFGVTGREQLMNGGAEVGVLKLSKKLGYEASLGYLNNMAETRFIYGVIKSTNELVGALAGHFSFNIHNFGFISNMVCPTRAFSSKDITYNGKGAKPLAYEAEINYVFKIRNHPLVPAFGYEQSSQALFLSLAKYRYVWSLEYVINAYLTATLELLKAKNYGKNETGTYATGASAFTTVTGNGAWSDSAIIQVAAHF